GGVSRLPAGDIPAFATSYREVAADLARARTYGVDPRVIAYLERVVSAGHNAFYRARGRRRTPLFRYLVRDFPAAVVQSWAYVFVVFANYHAGGYLGTFIAGHGVLELTAIFIAGGAGFRLAGAVLLPGDRTRRDALIVEGRVAARMIGAVVTLLAIAGTIGGLL